MTAPLSAWIAATEGTACGVGQLVPPSPDDVGVLLLWHLSGEDVLAEVAPRAAGFAGAVWSGPEEAHRRVECDTPAALRARLEVLGRVGTTCCDGTSPARAAGGLRVDWAEGRGYVPACGSDETCPDCVRP